MLFYAIIVIFLLSVLSFGCHLIVLTIIQKVPFFSVLVSIERLISPLPSCSASHSPVYLPGSDCLDHFRQFQIPVALFPYPHIEKSSSTTCVASLLFPTSSLNVQRCFGQLSLVSSCTPPAA